MTKEEWKKVKALVEEAAEDVLAAYGRKNSSQYPNLASETTCELIARDVTLLFENKAIVQGIVPQ